MLLISKLHLNRFFGKSPCSFSFSVAYVLNLGTACFLMLTRTASWLRDHSSKLETD